VLCLVDGSLCTFLNQSGMKVGLHRELAAYNSAKHSIRTVEPPLVFEDITEDVETVLSNSARMAMMTAEIL
jgi:hypothetical protein